MIEIKENPLENYSDSELILMTEQLNSPTIADTALVRQVITEIYGERYIGIIGMGMLLSVELAKRLKYYDNLYIPQP